MSCVVLSQNGRQMIQEMLNIGFIDEEHIQALNKIGTTSDPKLSNIKKPLIARLVKVMSDTRSMIYTGHPVFWTSLGRYFFNNFD